MDVAENFPAQCRYVLEMLGEVYGHDAKAREAEMAPEQRLQFHTEHSDPVMTELHGWLEAQIAKRKAEPNSGAGQGDQIPAAALASVDAVSPRGGSAARLQQCRKGIEKGRSASEERVVLPHAKRGRVGDLFMSLIHTCQLCGANSFEYLTELQRHARELAASPAEWMPWNYRQTLDRAGVG